MTPSTQDARATGLVELAVRCEQATGADRELDAKIARAVGAIPTSAAYEGTIKMGDKAWSNGCGYSIPFYSASLDAAISLVPEGYRLSMLTSATFEKSWTATIWVDDANIDIRPAAPRGKASTPALAVTAAAIRARLRAIGLAASTKDQPHEA